MRYSEKLKFLDVPNERSFHADAKPRGAGLGFVIAFFIGCFLFDFDMFIGHWYLFFALFLVFCVGLIDDSNEVSAKLKFIVIFVATFVLWLNGMSIDTLGEWFGYDINMIWYIALPFSMFAIAGFTNALNLMDGLDGLAGSLSIVMLAFFAIIGYVFKDNTISHLSLFMIAALFGFMILNWYPAKIFMGDSGSLALGFTLSILAIMSIKYIQPVVILYLCAVPILDTLIVMIRRIRRGRSPFSPDKTHLHHILVKFFDNNVQKSVIFLVMLQVIFSSIGHVIHERILANESGDTSVFALIGFVIMFLLFYMIFTGIKRRQLLIDSNKNK